MFNNPNPKLLFHSQIPVPRSLTPFSKLIKRRSQFSIYPLMTLFPYVLPPFHKKPEDLDGGFETIHLNEKAFSHRLSLDFLSVVSIIN